jgi:hypothetical protein
MRSNQLFNRMPEVMTRSYLKGFNHGQLYERINARNNRMVHEENKRIRDQGPDYNVIRFLLSEVKDR